MNLVDLVLVIFLTLFALNGFGKPLILEIYDLFSFLLAFLFSLKFYTYLTVLINQAFNLPHSFSNVLAFISLWYLVETFLIIFSHLFLKRLLRFLRFPGDTILSILPSFLKGTVFITIILILIITFPINPRFKEEIGNSKIASQILSRSLKVEAPLKQIFGELASDTLTFLTVEPKSNEKLDLGFKTSEFSFNEDLESAMINKVNQERLNQNLNALTYDPDLREIAREHSSDMFKRGYFSHYSPEGESVAERADKLGINYLVIGENLAFAPSLDLAHQGLMQSPGHRANILSPNFKKVGIAVAESPKYGLMITQVFSN